MRIIVIGAVAAGTSAAAKARRNSEQAEIVIYEKDSFISYSGCGMPYYIGGEVEHASNLTPRDPAFFKSKYNIDIHISHEVLSIHSNEKLIKVKNLISGKEFEDSYDKLIIATGASAMIPPIKGVDSEHVLALRNIIDMHKIKEYINNNRPKSAAIIGTGFIGLELCENFKELAIDVTLIEKLEQVTPGLDSDMAIYVEEYIKSKDIMIFTGIAIEEITENKVILSDNRIVDAELVIMATGVRPNTQLAKQAGVQTDSFGAIVVNPYMQTNIPDIYACGDCISQFHAITGKPVYRPLGSTANKTGRIAGENVMGGSLAFKGVLGTGIFRIFDMTVAQTGLSEKEAILEGYEIAVCHSSKPNKADYMGGKEIVIKGIADKKDGRLLGVQLIGYEGVDKRVDVFATAITYGAKAEDLFHLDLAYAPPFATAKDPVAYTGMILDNAINNARLLMTPKEFDALIDSGERYTLIDARSKVQYDKSHIGAAINMPHESIRSMLDKIGRDSVIITYCNKGVTGNAVQNILIENGFERVYNLSGGYNNFLKQAGREKK